MHVSRAREDVNFAARKHLRAVESAQRVEKGMPEWLA